MIVQLGCVCALWSNRRVAPSHPSTSPIRPSALSHRYCPFSLSLLRSSSLLSRRVAEQRRTPQKRKAFTSSAHTEGFISFFVCFFLSRCLWCPVFSLSLSLTPRVFASRAHTRPSSLTYSHRLIACALLFGVVATVSLLLSVPFLCLFRFWFLVTYKSTLAQT